MFRALIITVLCAGYLFIHPPAAQAADRGTIKVSKLNVRSGPGKKYRVVTRLVKGTQVRILSRKNGWLQIELAQGTGYIADRSRFVRILSGSKATPTSDGNKLKDLPEDADNIKQQLKKTRTEIATISRKEKAVIEEFNAGEQALNKARKRVRAARSAHTAIEEKIREIREQSKVLEEEIRDSEAYTAKRLVATYKLNWVGRIQLLATADSFFDFVNRKSALEHILNQDEMLLQKMHNNQSALESLLTEQKARLAEKRALELSLNAHISKLNTAQRQRQDLLKRIRSEKALGLAAMESLKQAALTLNETLDAMPPVPTPQVPEIESKPFKAYKGLLSWPVKGKIISFFGPYRDEKFKVMNFRSGIDIQAERGEPIRSICAGLMIYASWFKGFGNMMIIDHGDHYYTVYAHLEEIFKVKGDRVEKGEVIATVGDSGSLMGPALHFEVRHHGKPVDPLKWIQKG
jgi:septal ring factor EnvC (AmiA/AmiB activator)